MKRCVQLLKNHWLKKFPEVNVGFYLSLRSNFVHMGLDVPLYSIDNYQDFIDEINNFLSKDLGSCFEFVYPQCVLTVKWKFDYIICRKVKKEKQVSQWIHMYLSLYQQISGGMNAMAWWHDMTK